MSSSPSRPQLSQVPTIEATLASPAVTPMGRILAVAALAGLAGCSTGGSGGASRAATTSPTVVSPQGFGAQVLVVQPADGPARELCVLVAGDDTARARGLMEVTSLGGYDGMLFRYPSPREAAFWMYRTRLPLTIAWFDGAGRYLGADDMAPCTAEDASACPTYPAPGPIRSALEVPQGRLSDLGIEPGVTVTLAGSCTRG